MQRIRHDPDVGLELLTSITPGDLCQLEDGQLGVVSWINQGGQTVENRAPLPEGILVEHKGRFFFLDSDNQWRETDNFRAYPPAVAKRLAAVRDNFIQTGRGSEFADPLGIGLAETIPSPYASLEEKLGGYEAKRAEKSMVTRIKNALGSIVVGRNQAKPQTAVAAVVSGQEATTTATNGDKPVLSHPSDKLLADPELTGEQKAAYNEALARTPYNNSSKAMKRLVSRYIEIAHQQNPGLPKNLKDALRSKDQIRLRNAFRSANEELNAAQEQGNPTAQAAITELTNLEKRTLIKLGYKDFNIVDA